MKDKRSKEKNKIRKKGEAITSTEEWGTWEEMQQGKMKGLEHRKRNRSALWRYKKGKQNRKTKWQRKKKEGSIALVRHKNF